jgi:hypothetical protein
MIRAHESTKNISSSRNVRDVSKGIHYLDPDAAPLTAVMTKAATRKKVARNPKFEWAEKGLPPKTDLVNGAVTTGTTALVVDNAAYFGVNDVVKHETTGEIMRVTAINTGTNTLTVSRGVGSTVATNIADNADLTIIGNAHAEGSAKPAVRSHQETFPYNYTEIFRHTFGETETQANTDTYIDSGSSRTRLRMEKAIEHKVDIERAFLFGERNEDASDTNSPVRYTGGLLYWLTSNAYANTSTVTYAEISDNLEDVFAHSSSGSSRLLLAGPSAITALEGIAAAQLQTVSDRNMTYGVALRRLITGHGDLIVARHPLLTGPFAGYAFLVDPSKLAYRFIATRDTKLEENIQDNGDDRWTDGYLSEVGLEVANPENHAVWSGITV